MTKERRLGRGLEALLGQALENIDEPSSAGGDAALMANVYDIDRNPHQPREQFDHAEIASLAESLRIHGLLQPLLVRRHGQRYQLVAGERRLRAAILAGWTEVPVRVVEADDRQQAELALVENLQRRDLNALEKAASFERYLQTYGCSQEELAGRLNLDRSTVSNLIRLLELPAAVQDALRAGRITAGHARALLPLGDEAEQVAFARRIEQEQLSVRVTERLVQEAVCRADAEPLERVADAAPAEKPARSRRRGAHLAALEQELRTALGTKVEIVQRGRYRGRIVIQFAGHEEFERLRHYLLGPRTQARAAG